MISPFVEQVFLFDWLFEDGSPVPAIYWKTTPKNAEDTKIIGQFDPCPPAIVVIRRNLDEKTSTTLRTKLLAWMPDWQNAYGAFRPYYYADVQTFYHYLNELPTDMM